MVNPYASSLLIAYLSIGAYFTWYCDTTFDNCYANKMIYIKYLYLWPYYYNKIFWPETLEIYKLRLQLLKCNVKLAFSMAGYRIQITYYKTICIIMDMFTKVIKIFTGGVNNAE